MATRNKKGQFKKAAKASRVAGTLGGQPTPSAAEAAPDSVVAPPRELVLHLTKMRLSRDLSELEDKAKFAKEQHEEYMHQLSKRWQTVSHELAHVKKQLIEAIG